MSNASVIERMRQLIEQYQSNSVNAGEFERAIELYLGSLEFIDLDIVHCARKLSWDLVYAHYWEGDEEFGDPVDADKVRAEFRRFLDELPVGPS